MTLKHFTFTFRILFTALVTLLIGLHLAWDYFHEGVPSHHLLHREDLPSISNWWGFLLLPLFTWFLLFRIKRRSVATPQPGRYDSWQAICYGFLVMLIFGLALSYLFTIGSDFTGTMMLGLIVISFLIPVYRAEYLLGFVVGMFYTFGGILPILIGTLLWLVYTLNYKVIRTGFLYLVSKINLKTSRK
jgi:hypothetical protein